MKKQDVYEVIIKVFGLYCIWTLLSLFTLLYSFLGQGFSFSIMTIFVNVIHALLAYVCLYKTDNVMKILNLKVNQES